MRNTLSCFQSEGRAELWSQGNSRSAWHRAAQRADEREGEGVGVAESSQVRPREREAAIPRPSPIPGLGMFWGPQGGITVVFVASSSVGVPVSCDLTLPAPDTVIRKCLGFLSLWNPRLSAKLAP